MMSKVEEILEEVLVKHIATNELRNLYRRRAGIPQKHEGQRICNCEERGEPYNYDCPHAFELESDRIVCTKGLK